MKEFNFNTLQNLPVPGQWIENALAIPETEEQRPAAVPFWRKPRFIAMAATLVLVSALSIALFLTMGKPPVAVKSGSPSAATEIIWSTDEYGATIATEIVVVTDGDADQGGTSPTEAQSGIVRFFERLFGGDDSSSATEPTTASGSGQSGNSSPTTKTSPAKGGGTTFKSGATEGGTPSVTPTEPSDDPDPIEEPPYSTTAPTEDDDEIIIHGPGGWSSTEAPTEAERPNPTAIPWEPSTEAGGQPRPTDPPKPTQSLYKPSISVSVSGFTVSSILKEGGVVYCRIYDSSGYSYGDSDLYSDQHLASLSVGASGILSYTPRDHDILPEDGLYSYEFYTRSRKLVSGSANLSAT